MNNLDKLKSLRQKIYQDTTSNFGKHLQLFYEGTSLLLDASDILVSTEKVSDHHTADGASKTAAWRSCCTTVSAGPTRHRSAMSAFHDTTRQVGVCAIYKQFSGFELFLLPGRVHARPCAKVPFRGCFAIPLGKNTLGDDDANRWAVS